MSNIKIDEDDADNNVDKIITMTTMTVAMAMQITLRRKMEWNRVQISFERDIMKSSENAAQFCAAYLPLTIKEKVLCCLFSHSEAGCVYTVWRFSINGHHTAH